MQNVLNVSQSLALRSTPPWLLIIASVELAKTAKGAVVNLKIFLVLFFSYKKKKHQTLVAFAE